MDTKTYPPIGKKLAWAIARAGESQTTLAEKSGVAVSTINRLLNEDTDCNMTTYRALSLVLDPVIGLYEVATGLDFMDDEETKEGC